jgi:hypothetical protein
MVYCRTASGVLLKRLINNASNGGRLRIFDFQARLPGKILADYTAAGTHDVRMVLVVAIVRKLSQGACGRCDADNYPKAEEDQTTPEDDCASL